MERWRKQKSNQSSENTFLSVISVYDKQKNLRLNKKKARNLIEAILFHLKVTFKEVSIYFVSKKEMAKLHDQFFQDPTPTDCISFPMDEDHLGEIFVCPEVAIEYAEKKNLNPYEETALYIIHGLLHLIGYDDIEPSERRRMRKKEKSCMRHLYENNISLQ